MGRIIQALQAQRAVALGVQPTKGVRLPLCCFCGLVGAQSWMPAVGMVSDAYRTQTFSLEGLAPLALTYLGAFAGGALAFAIAQARGALTRGLFAVLAGALFSCLGSALLFLFEGVSLDRMGLLFALVGFLLGAGGCLLVMPWTFGVERLPKTALLPCALAVSLGCCGLAAFAQVIGASGVLLVLTALLSIVSAGCYVASASQGAGEGEGLALGSVRTGILRVGASFCCFGLLFAMMITQFLIAPHGRASDLTWVFGIGGVLAALLFLVVGRIARKRWDVLFAFRFAAVPVIIAFFPFDPGSDFSLKFALWFSTMALWCFATLAPGVVFEASRLLHVPLYAVAASGLCGLCAGAIGGYAIGWFVEWLNPSPNYLINFSAIAAMVLALLGSNIVVTRGSLARLYRSAVSAAESPAAGGFSLADNVNEVSLAYGLTKREADVIGILARGHGLNRVQEELFISEGTAITHRRHIYQKLGVHSKSELIDFVTHFGAADHDDD